jgi:DNA-binding MarR family transcriptional regulator
MLSMLHSAMPDKTSPSHTFLPRTSSRVTLAGRKLTTVFAENLRPLGLAPAQFLVLQELWAEPALTQRDLVARCVVEQATMAATLQRMERDGLITREPHPDDQRARLIRPTAHAVALRAPALAVAAAVDADLMAPLDAAERATLVDLLGRVTDRLCGGG